jgi:LmbE family N-acetylglucosaminyl deacetylase
MLRRNFLQFLPGVTLLSAQEPAVTVERSVAGRPHAGKVFAAIQPHADDIPLFAAGLTAKMIDEGYSGYMIRTTNDDMAGRGTVGETALANERDNDRLIRVMGLKGNFDLNYLNHRMDGVSPVEIRIRLIFLFRLLRVDTVVGYDPWGHYEENPDHYVTAKQVEAACWMAGMDKDYPEHFAAGLKPKSVTEKYYFARGPQLVNRIVDISNYVEKKIDAILVNVAQGPGGDTGKLLRQRLAREGKRLPVLGDDDNTANREYAREFLLANERRIGQKYGLKYAEAYHYIGPERDEVGEYIKRHAVPIR